MITLLSKILIPNRADTADPNVRKAYGMLCGGVGIVLNLLLFAVKYIAGMLTGSIAITADAFNNLSDAGSSVITLMGFIVAGKRRDQEHPFGHGRGEYIAGLIVSIIIILMGFTLLKDSAAKILSPGEIQFNLISAGILGASIFVKLYMAFYNRAISHKIDSVAMLATMKDSLSDATATSVVLISMLVFHYFGFNVDAWMGTIVSIMILWAGYTSARDTISPLLGSAPSHELVCHIDELVRSYDEIKGIHDLMVHDYGPGRLIISLHAEVSADGEMMQLHDVIDTIEQRLAKELNCQAIIHMDPIDTDDTLIAKTREHVQKVVQTTLGEAVTIHDFRMVSGPTHTNVIFDAVLPPECSIKDSQAKAKIMDAVRNLDGNLCAVVTIDHAYL